MIVYSEDALDDFERIFEFIAERDPRAALEHIAIIRDAAETLERHPYIGRPVSGAGALRELVISFGTTGYVALYEHSPDEAQVRIVAIRHQHEAGYRER